MNRTRKSLPIVILAALAMILTNCANSGDSSSDTAPDAVELTAARTYEPQALSDKCIPRWSFCASWPIVTVGKNTRTDEINTNGQYTKHHRVSTDVPVNRAGGTKYCTDTDENCDDTETYFVDILPVNKVNSVAVMLPSDGTCSLAPITITGVKGSKETCIKDGIKRVNRLVVQFKNNIYVVSGETTANEVWPHSLDEFQQSFGLDIS